MPTQPSVKFSTPMNMANFDYYSLPGFGEQCRKEYGFSDSCIIGDRMIITGQSKYARLIRENNHF